MESKMKQNYKVPKAGRDRVGQAMFEGEKVIFESRSNNSRKKKKPSSLLRRLE